MNDNDRRLRAESLLRLTENNDGKLLIKELSEDFDKAMRNVLYCPDEELRAARGHARALHEQLKKFEDARKTLGK